MFAFLGAAVVASLCSIGVSFGPPSDDVGLVLVRSTGVRTTVAVPQDALYDAVRVESREVHAHGFVVIRAVGGPVPLQPGDTILAVPWAYDASCSAMPWTEDEWVPTGDEGVFQLGRPRTGSVGHPLFDVLGWHTPYPQGLLLEYEATGEASDRSEWLSPRELLELLMALPDGDAQATLRVFEAGPQRWSVRFPGREILARARRAVRQPGR